MRRWFIGILVCLAMVFGVAAGLGRFQWGAWGWYYHLDADYRLRAGLDAMQRGNLERTAAIVQLLKDQGHLEHAALLQGESLFRQAKELVQSNQLPRATPLLLQAVTELNNVLDGSPLHLRAVTLQGLCFMHLGQPDDVAKTLGYVVSRDPDNADAHRGLAVLYEDQGASLLALVHLKRVAELDASDGRPHRLMGLIHKDYEHYAEAVAAYEESLRRQLHGLPPESIRKEMAECLVKKKDFAGALEVLDQFLPLPEDVAAVAALRAESLVALGRSDEARNVLDATLADQPPTPALLVQRARLHLTAGEAEKAATLLQKAVAFDRHDYDARYQLMLAYRALGRKAEADEQQREAEASRKYMLEFTKLHREAGDKPWDRCVRLRLAEVCDKLDKPHDAALWRQSAAACPASPVPEGRDGRD